MSRSSIDNFKEILSTHGYKVTTARVATFQLLERHEPQSIKDLLVQANGSIDRVSLYRNIELFEKLGIVHRITSGWKYKLELSDDFISHHHHMSCSSCGKLIDIADNDQIEAFIQSVSDKHQFTVRSHSFEIEGICHKCSTKP